MNRRQVDNLGERVTACVSPGETVGILGLSYKAGTNVTDESFGVHLAVWLAAKGIDVVAFDPSGAPSAARQLGESVRLAESAAAVVDHCQVLVLATPWPEFAAIGASLGAHNRVHDLFDCWRQLPPSLATGARVRQVGVGPDTRLHGTDT